MSQKNWAERHGRSDHHAAWWRAQHAGSQRHDGPRCHRHHVALRGRRFHLRSSIHFDCKLRIEDHLRGWRRRGAALLWLSDRAACGTRQFSRDLLPAALWRASDPGAEVGFRPYDRPPHDDPRADGAVLSGLPSGRAPNGGHGRLCRRAVGLLSRLHRHPGSMATRDGEYPHDRENADHRRDGVQIFGRTAFRVPEERSGLLGQLLAHVLRRAVRGL